MGELSVGEYIILRDRLYTKSDEWVLKTNNTVTVGITDYAQKKLKDIVGVELPEVGREVEKEESIAVVESIKAAADVYSPVSGVVVEVNEDLYDAPETINADPYGEGWMFKIELKDPKELEELLSPEDYAKKVAEEES